MSSGRGATAWRPWADGGHWVGELARHVDPISANGRDAVAPLPSGRYTNSRGDWKPERRLRLRNHSQVPGLGRRVSGSGIRVQVQVQSPNPFLTTRTRDLRMNPGFRSPLE